MKKILLAVLALVIVSCGSKSIKDDASSTSDFSSRFESVFTSVGTESSFGSAVYQVKDTKASLKIYTLLDGSYEVKSNSCNFQKTGRFEDNQVITIPLAQIIKDSPAEKLCMITIQINPEYAKSKYKISPRYAVVYLQLTTRSTESHSFQFPEHFAAGRMFELKDLEKYRLIQNCVNVDPLIIKESTSPATATIDFDELQQSNLGSCYYSLVYTKAGVASRLAFSINLYDSKHSPLEASATQDGKKIEVVSESTVSICVIGDEYKLDNHCKGDAKDGVLIQVHSNKRSFYQIWRKQ